MKLINLTSSNYKLDQILKTICNSSLNESILDYFAVEISKMKDKENPFDGDKGVDIEKLARLVSAMKILADKETRSIITKDDVGINVNSIKDVYDMLDKYNTSGTDGKKAEEVIYALSALSNRITNEIKQKIKDAKNPDERNKIIVELNKLYDKARMLMSELKKKMNNLDLTTNSVKFA